jgi:hypothetical protein
VLAPQAIAAHVDFEKVKAVVVASPGFVKDDFLKYLFAEAARAGDKPLLRARDKARAARCFTANLLAARQAFVARNRYPAGSRPASHLARTTRRAARHRCTCTGPAQRSRHKMSTFP